MIHYFSSINKQLVITLSVVSLGGAGCRALWTLQSLPAMMCGRKVVTFYFFQCMILFFRALYGFIRYAGHVYDLGQEATWENRTSFLYYTELVFELLVLMTDFVHHIHMLVS